MTAVAALCLALAVGLGQPTTPPVGVMRARLAPVPIDVSMQEAVAGLGAATATLADSKLTVEGMYRGLKSPATTVRVFDSPRPGMRGQLVGEFASEGGTTGAFKGVVTLTREQAAAYAKGLVYVQLQSEKAPDGNLWGWLTVPKGQR